MIEPSGIDAVETKTAGTGAYTLAERVLGQRIRLVANPKYWRAGQPVAQEIVFTVFSDNEAAAAALESGGVDLIYGASARSAVRLRDAGYQLDPGTGAAWCRCSASTPRMARSATRSSARRSIS